MPIDGRDVVSSKNLVSVADYQYAASKRLPRIAFDYLEPGAEDQVTCHRNREVFRSFEFQPRVLRDVAQVDLSTDVLGARLGLPLVVGPTGFAGLFWPDADKHLAAGAANAAIPFVLSTASTSSIEDVASHCNHSGTRWFQLYLLKDRDATADMVARADAAGYEALVLTVDTPCAGKREASMRHGSRLPLRLDAEKVIDFMRHPAWTLQILRHGQPHLANFPHSRRVPFVMEAHLKRDIGWDDVRWLRSVWKKPIILKGIQSVEDARLAAEHGIDGIVISNHGGRQLDGAPSPMQILEHAAQEVGSHLAVMADSGFRRGADVVKALALGARCIWLGRATLYGVATSGRSGVDNVLSVIEDEMRRTMTLLGLRSLDEIDDSVIRRISTAG